MTNPKGTAIDELAARFSDVFSVSQIKQTVNFEVLVLPSHDFKKQ